MKFFEKIFKKQTIEKMTTTFSNTKSPTTKIPFEAYTGRKPYIFVSYAHLDSEMVFSELSILHKNGYRIWYDEGIDPGNEWPFEIANALNAAHCFLVFISSNSIKSKNVHNEINFAINKKKPFFAIHLEDIVLPLGLELRMGDTQAILKWRMSQDYYWRKIKKIFPQKLMITPLQSQKNLKKIILSNNKTNLSSPNGTDKSLAETAFNTDPIENSEERLDELFSKNSLGRFTFIETDGSIHYGGNVNFIIRGLDSKSNVFSCTGFIEKKGSLETEIYFGNTKFFSLKRNTNGYDVFFKSQKGEKSKGIIKIEKKFLTDDFKHIILIVQDKGYGELPIEAIKWPIYVAY